MLRLVVLSVVGVLAGGPLIGCGDDDQQAGGMESDAPDRFDTLHHVHGLGVDRDGSLLVASHTGLFRVAPGEMHARRAGESRHDLTAFAVREDGTLLASGHPAPRENLPQDLGLIASEDGGRTWQSVSLLGKASFHALAVQGHRLYGFDSPRERLLASADGGRTWEERPAPGVIHGLAIHPDDAETVAASTLHSVALSGDGGRSWHTLAVGFGGPLAWSSSHGLLLLELDGSVLSGIGDAGGPRQIGHLEPMLLASATHGTELYVADHSNAVYQSRDGGRRWALRATGEVARR